MNDLISRKALLETFEEHKNKSKKFHEIIFFDAVMAIIDTQPTAYDVDKVVEDLKVSDFYIDQEKCITVEDAISIVKGAVKDEQ